MDNAIKSYIAEQSETWSESTTRSESKRLTAMAAHLDGNPRTLWKFLQQYGEYSRVTYWARAAHFWGWLKPNEVNVYDEFRKKKLTRQFKVAYVRRTPEITFEGAAKALSAICDEQVRSKCLELISSGMRWTESHTLSSNGEVTGKGGRRRKVFVPPSGTKVGYWRVYRALKAVGLTPHALRKIWAAEMVKRGATAHQLLRLGGWTNLNTTQSYVQAQDSDLERLAKI